MIILDLYLLCAITIENIKVRKIASSRFNYVFQFIIVCSYLEQRWYWIFFHAQDAIKYRNEFHRGSYLFNVHTLNISLMVTNSFLCLQFLSISFIKQSQVSLHNLLAPLRLVSFSISHLSLSITTVVPRVLQSQACASLPPLLSLLTLHSPFGCPHWEAFFLSVLNWRIFFRDSSTAWFFYNFIITVGDVSFLKTR